LEDPLAILYRLGEEGGMEVLQEGPLALYKERLQLAKADIPLGEISDMSLVARSGIVFTRNGEHYRIVSPQRSFCGRKYLLFYDALKGRPFSI